MITTTQGQPGKSHLAGLLPSPTKHPVRESRRSTLTLEALERRLLFAGDVDELMALAAGQLSSTTEAQLLQQPAATTKPAWEPKFFVGPIQYPTVIAGPENEPEPPAPRPASDFRYILRPGTGWTGPTPQPDPVGTPGAPGYDAKSIARWDVVPYQTFDDIFHIGVVAFHMNGIDRVEFSVNGGDWTAVRTMTKNPQTDVYEYTATLRAADFPDGPLEVRAIAWPTTGEARVLDSLPLNSNGSGTLPSLIRWVSPTGSDTTGDGSEQNPFGTIMKAARSIQDASGTGNADGGTIYLTAGDHVYGTYSFSLTTTTLNRWLTITAAPGVARGDVRLTGSGTSDGIRTALVRLHNLTITGAVNSNGPLQDSLWLDAVSVIGPGRHVNTSLTGGWSTRYVTDSTLRSARDGFQGELIRNSQVDDIGSDAFSNSGMVVNCTASNVDHTGTSFHPDVVQYHSRHSNLIVYGLEATENIRGQGMFAGDMIDLTDVAFVNLNINNQNPITSVGRVFQFGGPTVHFYVLNSAFVGPSTWMSNFSAQNVVIENTTFTSSPGPHAGVTYR